jgi:hypothetical protein
MIRLQMMINELSKRADESDLVALLATSRQARLYNADLAREIRDVVGVLRKELDQRQGSVFCQSTGIRMDPKWRRDAMDDRAYIARLNIEHYRQKLLTEQDEATRQRISQLLAEEAAKLAALSDQRGENEKS